MQNLKCLPKHEIALTYKLAVASKQSRMTSVYHLCCGTIVPFLLLAVKVRSVSMLVFFLSVSVQMLLLE